MRNKNNARCSHCSYKTKTPPTTGICPKCGKYSVNWSCLDKKTIITSYKIKMYGCLLIALILLLCAYSLWGVSISSFEPPVGGKGNLLLIPLLAISFLGSYFLSEKTALTFGFILISLFFLVISYIYRNKLKILNKN